MTDEKKQGINMRKLISRAMLLMMAWRFLRNRANRVNTEPQETTTA
jgi:hypothetical protein